MKNIVMPATTARGRPDAVTSVRALPDGSDIGALLRLGEPDDPFRCHGHAYGTVVRLGRQLVEDLAVEQQHDDGHLGVHPAERAVVAAAPEAEAGAGRRGR